MTRSRAVLLVAGIGWILLYVGGTSALGSSIPTINSSGDEVVGWFEAHQANVQWYSWSQTFAYLALVVFGGQIAALLPKPHRYIFFGGILGWAITALVQAWVWSGLAFDPGNLDPATARVLFDIPLYWGPLINGATMTMAAPFVALGFSGARGIPGWLWWLSLLFLVEQGVETVTVFGRSGFFAPDGPMNLYLGGLIGMAWVIAVIVWGYQRLTADTEPT